MEEEKNLVANPAIVLREEFDDWAILFDPDTSTAFGVNPTAVLIWKMLDGNHSVEDISGELRAQCSHATDNNNIAARVEEHIRDFLQNLVALRLVSKN